MVTRMRKCTGKRSFRHVLWGELPFCFMVECKDNQLSPHARRLNQLQHSLKVNDTTYVLAQVILYNGSHFQGITVVEGKFLFYDGIGQGNRLKWIPFEYEWGARYQPHILWYKNSDRVEQEHDNRNRKQIHLQIRGTTVQLTQGRNQGRRGQEQSEHLKNTIQRK